MNDLAVLESTVNSVPSTAQAIRIIETSEHFEQASEVLKTIKGLRAEIDANYNPIIAAAHKTHQEALGAKKKVALPLDMGEAHLKPLMAAYLTEEARKRQAEQRRMEQEAKRQQEEEVLAAAVHAEQQGDQAEAEAILAAPIVPPPVVAPRTTPRVEGISQRALWAAEVTDLRALCKAVAEGRVDVIAVQPNMVYLGNQARVLKTLLNIPGVKAVSTTTIAARR